MRDVSKRELFSKLAWAYQSLSRSKKQLLLADQDLKRIIRECGKVMSKTCQTKKKDVELTLKKAEEGMKRSEGQMQEAVQFSRENDKCGNQFCGPSETIKNCSQDCGTAPAICGDGTCQLPEITICIKDCAALDFNPNDYIAWCQQQEGRAWHDLYCPYCGDGVLNQPSEECDGGELNSNTIADVCRTDCRNPRCGDGVVDRGEQCEGSASNCVASACIRRPPPPLTCTCKNPNDPKTCPTRPVPPNDPHYGTCSSSTTPWTKIIGRPELVETAAGIAVDANGTVYTSTLEDSRTELGGYLSNFVVRQYDTCGNLIWEDRISGASSGGGSDHLDIDSCGNVYVTGTNISNEAFVRKYPYSGPPALWTDFGPMHSNGMAIAVQPDGTVYAAWEQMTELPNENPNRSNLQLKKYLSNGISAWSSAYDISGSDRPMGASVDPSGNVYLSVWVTELEWAGGLAYNILSDQAWIMRYDPAGVRAWSVRLGANEGSCSRGREISSSAGITVGGDGDLYVAADSLNTGRGGSNMLFIQLDPDGGTFLTDRCSSYSRPAEGIAVDGEGNLLTTSAMANFTELLITKTSLPSGVLWEDFITGPRLGVNNGMTQQSGVAIDPLNYVYLLGSLHNTTIDPPPDDGLWLDVILRKYTPAGEGGGWPYPLP